MRAEPEPALDELDAMKGKELSSPRAFEKALLAALEKAGVKDVGEQDRILGRVLPAKNGKKYTLSDEGLAKLHKEAERSLDFLRPVPEEVVAKLGPLRDKELVAQEFFMAALEEPLKEGLNEAGVRDPADRSRLRQRAKG